MDTSLVVVVWGLGAIAVNVLVGRWCRSHPGPDGPRRTRS